MRYSIVLEGRLGVFQDDEEVIARPGDIVFKPRGHWHAFWNAGEGRLRILEVIAPGGIEAAFRVGEPGGDPATLLALVAQYGGEVDFDRTMPLVERHNLVFLMSAMSASATCPEELEAMLEDACLLSDASFSRRCSKTTPSMSHRRW